MDEFLDELTDDYTALYKENAALKAKLKVLVEKVEEYRATEESMRASAADGPEDGGPICAGGGGEAGQMLAEAESEAQEQIGRLRHELAGGRSGCCRRQEELAEFIRRSRGAVQGSCAFLDQLPELDVAPQARRRACGGAEETTCVLHRAGGCLRPLHRGRRRRSRRPAAVTDEATIRCRPWTAAGQPRAASIWTI